LRFCERKLPKWLPTPRKAVAGLLDRVALDGQSVHEMDAHPTASTARDRFELAAKTRSGKVAGEILSSARLEARTAAMAW